VVEVINSQDGSFTQSDLSFLETICGKISSMMARRRLVEEKSKSQRLATIGQLTDTIVHDFKNPMSIIKGMADVMAAKELPEEKRIRYCRTISSQVERCMGMTREILEFTKGEVRLDLQPVCAELYLGEIIEILEFETERNHVKLNFEMDFKGDVTIDSDRLKRVIFNLTNNAMEVLKGVEEPELSISAQKIGTKLQLKVADNGPGIPEAIKNTLFEAFATHGKKGGTGLGLHIAKEIVEAHGGSIIHDQTWKEGACFQIELPLTP